MGKYLRDFEVFMCGMGAMETAILISKNNYRTGAILGLVTVLLINRLLSKSSKGGR